MPGGLVAFTTSDPPSWKKFAAVIVLTVLALLMTEIGVTVAATFVTAGAVAALTPFTTSVKPGATAVTQVSAAAEDSSAAFRLTTLTVRRRSRFLTLFSFKWLAKFPQPGTPGGEVGFGGTKFRALEASNVVWRTRPVLCTVNP